MEEPRDNAPVESDLQVEKTKLEIEVLRKSLRPSYRNAPIALGAIGAVVTIVGLTIQWRDASKNTQIAELRTHQAVAEAAAASSQLAEAKEQLSKLQSDLDGVRLALKNESNNLTETATRLKQTQSSLTTTSQSLKGKQSEVSRIGTVEQSLQSRVRDLQDQESQMKKRISDYAENIKQLASKAFSSGQSSQELLTQARAAIRKVYDDTVAQLAELRPTQPGPSEPPSAKWFYDQDYKMFRAALSRQVRELEDSYPWLKKESIP